MPFRHKARYFYTKEPHYFDFCPPCFTPCCTFLAVFGLIFHFFTFLVQKRPQFATFFASAFVLYCIYLPKGNAKGDQHEE